MKDSYCEIPENLYTHCPSCKRMIYTKQLVEDLMVCECGRHFKLGAVERLNVTLDRGSFVELFAGLSSNDPLKFPEYREKINRDRQKTGLNDAMIAGTGRISGFCVNIGVLDFGFMGGSMGSVVGEKVAQLMRKTASEEGGSLLIFTASGGARMQEGLISLMQMAKTCVARSVLRKSRRPFYCVLTDPTTAGVWASFASIADVIIAEPGAMVAFAGDRVSRQTQVKEELPDDYKSAEFQLRSGMVDLIVERSSLRSVITELLEFSHTRRE